MMTSYKTKFLISFSSLGVILALLNAQTAKPTTHSQRILFNLEVPIKASATIPADVLTILESSPEVKTSRCVEDEAAFGKFSGAWFEAAQLHLTGSNDPSLLVKAKNGCLMGANIGPFWIFRNTPKGHELILAVNAIAVEILGSSSDGYRDVRAIAIAGGETRSVNYKFNGKQYVRY